MQSCENERDSLGDLRMARTLYPEGNGYRYETGGMLGNLRTLTNDRVKKFHKDMYQPKNLCLCIIGDADKDQLFEILNEFETNIAEDVPSATAPFRRPWFDTDSTASLEHSSIQKISFPEDDESVGALFIAFLGPPCTDILQGTLLLNLKLFH